MAEQDKKKFNILDVLEEDKQKLLDRRESVRTKLQGAAKEYKEEGSPIRAGLAKAAEWFLPEKGEDPYVAAMGSVIGGPGGKLAKKAAKGMAELADDASKTIIKMLRERGIDVADTIAESPKARANFVKALSKQGKSPTKKQAQELADKFAPTTKRNITDIRVEGKKFSPEVRGDAAQRAAGKSGMKEVKVAEEIDYSGLVPKVKPRK